MVRPLSADGLKRALEEAGWALVDEGQSNWIFAKGKRIVPVPKTKRRVKPAIMEDAMAGDADTSSAIFRQLAREPAGYDDDELVDASD